MTRLITIFIMLSGVVLGQTYNVAITNQINVGDVAVTALVEIAEGAVTVDSSVNLTNIITIENNTYNQTTITSTGGTIDVSTDGTNYNLEALGGGSSLSVYDSTNGLLSAAVTSLQFSGFTLTGSNAVVISQISYPESLVGSNRQTYTYTGSQQTFVTPSGISRVTFWLWSGCGSDLGSGYGGVGGHTWAVCNATNGQVFYLDVGQGGQTELPTGTYSYGTAAWPDGGRGMTGTNLSLRIPGGGGSSRVWTDGGTSLVAVAGASAGGSQFSDGFGGGGGGLTGGDSTLLAWPVGYAGYGATQTNGGSGVWATGGAAATLTNIYAMPTAGAYLSGGNGGVSTNAVNVAGGGGGGYYGGGGSLKGTGTGRTASGGGGGSGYVNPNKTIVGATTRQTITSGYVTVPIGQDLPFYVPGVATRPSSATTAGGNGQITVGY